MIKEEQEANSGKNLNAVKRRLKHFSENIDYVEKKGWRVMPIA